MTTLLGNQIRLEDAGDLRSGLLNRPKPARAGTALACRVLQAGDLATDGTVDWKNLPWGAPAGSVERSEVREGDVLVPLRSTRVGALVAREVPPRTVAVGHWALVTTHPCVDPNFLAWYLNHPSTARQLQRHVVGTNIPFVPLSAMRDLEVEVPPEHIQHRIVLVDALHRRLADLERRLADTREHYVQHLTRAALDRAAAPTL